MKLGEWIQIDDLDNPVSVWAREEVLNGKPRARGYRMYGRSKVLRCWAMGQIIRWLEMYQWAAYAGNRAPDIMVSVPWMTQAEVNVMVEEYEKFKSEHPEYKDIFWLGLANGTPTGEGMKLGVDHIMGSLADLDAVALTKHYTEAVSINFGVSLVMMGMQEAGKLGRPEEVLTVSYDTIEEVQTQVEEFVNGKFLPLFRNGVEDQWEFELLPPAPKDEQQQAAEALGWAQAIKALQDAGATARLDPAFEQDWPIEILDWPILPTAKPVSPGAPPGEAPAAPQAPGPPDKPVDDQNLVDAIGLAHVRRKALRGRNLPRSEAPPGILAFENDMVRRLGLAFDKAVRDVKRQKGRDLGEAEIRVIMADVLASLKDYIARRGAMALKDAYAIGIAAGGLDFPMASFDAYDQTVLDFLETHPDMLAGSLSKVIDDAKGILNTAIRDSFARGLDSSRAIESAAKELDASKWRVERVVRSKTTQIVNLSRAAQFEKYGDSTDRYDWIVSMRHGTADERVEAKCLTIAAQNPWRLEDLRRATENFLPHPNCRCTVGRRPGGL
jgi:hypothetical protein